jgi:hypothetical protein
MDSSLDEGVGRSGSVLGGEGVLNSNLTLWGAILFGGVEGEDCLNSRWRRVFVWS